jgi:NADPH2:quinone reductase
MCNNVAKVTGDQQGMRAVVCEALEGAAGVTVREDWPEPKYGAGEVLIEVKSAALNFPDILITQGKYQVRPEPPFVIGAECAGVVAAVGADVRAFKPGDRVIARSTYGLVAERVAVAEASVMPAPRRLDFDTCCGISITYFTTYHALKQRALLKPGETLLVLGAAGGVGTAAIDLGKALGAVVIAAASSPAKLEVARRMGADHLIDYGSEDLKTRIKELTGGKGVDVVYDPVGGALAEPAVRGMAYLGRYLVIGFAAGEIPRIPLNLPLLKNCSLIGVYWGSFVAHEPAVQRRNVQELWELIDAGKVNPLVGAVYPLEQHAAAFAELTERRITGKCVLHLAD